MAIRPKRQRRTGGIYLAVLATGMMVALLGLTAMIGQRLQNRMILASTSIRQAQLNANTAVELGLLAIKQNTTWRTTYSGGTVFTNRGANIGTCSLTITDPVDGNIANSADDPFVLTGIGYSGDAEQRVQITVDPKKGSLSCLRSAIAAGGNITLSSDTLRTSGLTTANQISATSSFVYGDVEALAVTGGTYYGTTSQVLSEKRPTMPDWTSVFNYYRTNGTEININTLPSQMPNLARNPGIESGTTDWTGTAIGMSEADIELRTSPIHGGTRSLRVKNRDAWYAGASQSIEGFVKPGQQYTVDIWVNLQQGVLENFYVSMFTKGSGNGSAQIVTGPSTTALLGIWRQVSATLTAPAWSGNLEYAYIKIAGADGNNVEDFVTDDLTIRETTSGRFIYRQVISPNRNPFGVSTNAEGIYWINCNGSKVVIERSRILGTLLLLNPGAGSCIANGPISWSPAVAGYPALLVDATTAADADFTINATNRALSESENSTNYNPAGSPDEEFGQDSDTNDIYRSAIRGLVAVRDDLLFQNRPLIRGQVIVGDEINNPSGELEVEYLPDSLLNPPPGFVGPYTYVRRPSSLQKVVVP